MNELLQNAIRRFLPNSKGPGISEGLAQITPCGLKPNRWFGKVVVFQIDAQSLQYCVTNRRFRSTEIIDFGKIYRPRTGDRLVDHAAFLGEEILRLKKQHNLSGARYGLSISSSDVAVRTLRIPKMSSTEERQAVYYEGDKSVPFPLSNAYWSYRRCECITTDTSCDITITLMALPKTALDDILQFFSSIDVTFDFINQDIEALGLPLCELPDFDEKQPYGLLNIRPARTDISLYHGDRLKFLHHGAFGSLALGQSLQFNSAAAASFMPQALDNFAEGLANTIQQALDYYGAQHGFDDVATFYIYGDFTYSADLIDTLTQKFGMTFKRFPVEIFSKSSFIDNSLKELLPVALPVVAAASSKHKLSDFTPTSVHQHNWQRRFVGHAIAASIFVILGLGIASSFEWWQGKIAKSGLEDATQIVSRFEASPAYAGYRILKEELMRQETIIHELENKTSQHYLALKEIAAMTPASIQLDFLQYYPKERNSASTLTGSVISQLVAPEVILAEYASRLGGSPLFTNVRLKNHTKRIEGGTRTVTFSIDLNSAL